MVREVKVVLDPDVRKLCIRPYYNHPKGCPNYGKKPGCPPQAPMLGGVLDLAEPVFAVWAEFDLAAHRKKMLKKHPLWSKRQADCCLYWQGTLLKELRHVVANFCTMRLLFRICDKIEAVFCPEAMGVNVTATMAGAGVNLEWPPENTVRKVALVGTSVKKGE